MSGYGYKQSGQVSNLTRKIARVREGLNIAPFGRRRSVVTEARMAGELVAEAAAILKQISEHTKIDILAIEAWLEKLEDVRLLSGDPVKCIADNVVLEGCCGFVICVKDRGNGVEYLVRFMDGQHLISEEWVHYGDVVLNEKVD